MDKSNTKSEPVDKQPTIKDNTAIKSEPIAETKDPARFPPPPTHPPPHPGPPPPPPPFPIFRDRYLAPPLPTRWPPPPSQRALLYPPPFPPRHPLPPPSKALPPRTTRADFITPDQRAIFGPPVQPKERTDRVGPNGL